MLCVVALIGTPSAHAQVEWTDDRYFPAFASADTVDVIPVFAPYQPQNGEEVKDMTVDQNPDLMHALTLAAMQGLINRDKPSVFLTWTDTTAFDPDVINTHWASVVESYVETVHHELTNLDAIAFLYAKHQSRFEGSVIYNPKIPDTINLATMIAGLENRMMLAPEQLGMEGIPEFGDVRDLRDLAAEQNWDDSFDSQLAIYQWTYENLWPDLERRIISMESPGPPTSGEVETPDFFFRPSIASRDYVVALKLPALYLNPKYPDHEVLLDKFLQEMPRSAVMMGGTAFSESGVVWAGSKYGHIQAAIAWPGEATTAGNLTLLSGIRPAIKKAPEAIDEENIFASLAASHVATLFTSDGDAIFYQMARGFLNLIHWENVQGQNFGWETNPILTELAPAVWNYYMDTADEVTFVSGLSGAGYISPRYMNESELATYLDRTAQYLEDSGLRVVRFNGLVTPWDSSFAASYYEQLQGSGHLGTIVGFGEARLGSTLQFLGQPVPAVTPLISVRGPNVDRILDAVVANTPNVVFMRFRAQPGVAEISEVPDDSATTGSAILISTSYAGAESCCLAFSAGPMTLMPGHYRVSTRLKVTDNASPNQIASLYAGTGFTEPEPDILGTMSVLGTDFTETGRYQEFTYEIEVDDLLPDVQFRLDYGDGSTDLYADNISATNESEPNFPVLAPLYMNFGIAAEFFEGMEQVPSRVKELLEPVGGVVLTPNEFFASLNPEYMLDLARRRLGNGNESVVEAQALFDSGDYFSSLNVIRGALKAVVAVEDELPGAERTLVYNYPNPFADRTKIVIDLVEVGRTEIFVHDVMGRRVAVLLDTELGPGRHVVEWDGKSGSRVEVAAGMYLVRVVTPGGASVAMVAKVR